MRPNIEYCRDEIEKIILRHGDGDALDARHHLESLYNELLRLRGVIESLVRERDHVRSPRR